MNNKLISQEVLNVLALEDSVPDFEIIQFQLLEAGYNLNITHAKNEIEFRSALSGKLYDIILADYNLPGFDAFKALEICKEVCPMVPFICVSGSIGEETAIDLLKLGAVDYVLKDRPERLPFAIQRALDEAKEIIAIRQAENEIKKSKKSWEGIFHGLSHPTVILDANNNILEINDSLRKKIGKDLAELKKLKCWQIFHSPYTSCPPEGCPFKQMILSNSATTSEMEIEAFGGYYLVNCTPILDDEGKLEKVIHIATDITERKLAERELILAKEHAEESDRLKTAFLCNMSHEIRTPMNGILGFAELLKEPGLTGEEQQEYVRIIEIGGARLLNIINDIVDISKIESGQMEVAISETNVNEKMEFIRDFFQSEVEKKGLQLSLINTLPPKQRVIRTDPEKLYSILTNLVKNAIKYTLKGSIELGVDLLKTPDQKSYLQFFVKDTGIGIQNDRLEAIFERFIQADIIDKMARQGAGLGLSISKAYVEMLGGKIWVESKPGVGSTFYFTLPFEAENPEEEFEEKEISILSEEKLIRKLKILIVEDDEASSKLITFIVQKIGTELLLVTSGVQAIETCRNHPDIDLILMDIQLPEMDGYEATRQIRKFNKKMIIIAQTAFALAGDREKALEAGCNDYISKPIKKEELLMLMQKHF